MLSAEGCGETVRRELLQPLQQSQVGPGARGLACCPGIRKDEPSQQAAQWGLPREPKGKVKQSDCEASSAHQSCQEHEAAYAERSQLAAARKQKLQSVAAQLARRGEPKRTISR